MSEPQLKILPLGGLGEIGMNCLVVEYAGDMVLIDCGVQFPDQTYNGVDILIPDLSYVRERLSSLRAIEVTHGHDDHIGAILIDGLAALLLKLVEDDVFLAHQQFVGVGPGIDIADRGEAR